MIYALIGCLIIIGFLGVKLYQKQKIDKEVLAQYNLDIDTAKTDLHELVMQQRTEIQRIAQYKTEYKQYKQRAEEYQDLINNKFADIDSQIEQQRQKRQEELDKSFTAEEENYKLQLNNIMADCKMREKLALEQTAQSIQASEEQRLEYLRLCGIEQARYESLLAPIKQYEKEKQEKLFYTIQLPDEYKDDIEFLLTTVAPRLFHKDIIYKLIWNEYIRPPFDDLVKRLELQSAPGIYKITNITDAKCYIGKSADVKKRLTEHIKGSLGLSTISDQEIHHAIKEQGFDNWAIEVITYCEKEKLNELEKYYIEFFKSQEWGYNKRAGG